MKRPILLSVSLQEHATILAALRYWQEQGLADDPALRSDALHDIACPEDVLCSLNGEGVDELCEHLNEGVDPVSDEERANGPRR